MCKSHVPMVTSQPKVMSQRLYHLVHSIMKTRSFTQRFTFLIARLAPFLRAKEECLEWIYIKHHRHASQNSDSRVRVRSQHMNNHEHVAYLVFLPFFPATCILHLYSRSMLAA